MDLKGKEPVYIVGTVRGRVIALGSALYLIAAEGQSNGPVVGGLILANSPYHADHTKDLQLAWAVGMVKGSSQGVDGITAPNLLWVTDSNDPVVTFPPTRVLPGFNGQTWNSNAKPPGAPGAFLEYTFDTRARDYFPLGKIIGEETHDMTGIDPNVGYNYYGKWTAIAQADGISDDPKFVRMVRKYATTLGARELVATD